MHTNSKGSRDAICVSEEQNVYVNSANDTLRGKSNEFMFLAYLVHESRIYAFSKFVSEPRQFGHSLAELSEQKNKLGYCCEHPRLSLSGC